jgi:hypothetical protein
MIHENGSTTRQLYKLKNSMISTHKQKLPFLLNFNNSEVTAHGRENPYLDSTTI